MRPFQGMVVDVDPADPDKAYQVIYEDLDIEWMPASTLTPLLIAGPEGADVVALTAMAALCK